MDAAIKLSKPGFDRRGIRVELAMAAGLRFQANPDHIAQVLLNLFQNAARYTPEGGAVSIRTEIDGRYVVFERSYRVEKSRDRSRGGAGIGLAVVKQLIEVTGGQVGVESGGGPTRFWFSLPT